MTKSFLYPLLIYKKNKYKKTNDFKSLQYKQFNNQTIKYLVLLKFLKAYKILISKFSNNKYFIRY